jgi:hypothetical protein
MIVLRIFDNMHRGETYQEKLTRVDRYKIEATMSGDRCEIRQSFYSWMIPRGGKIEITAED